MIAVYAKRPPARAPHDLSALGTVYCSGETRHDWLSCAALNGSHRYAVVKFTADGCKVTDVGRGLSDIMLSEGSI
jgi:hypothetical protein